MPDILLALLELFFDFLIEFGGEALLDLLSHTVSDLFAPIKPRHSAFTIVGCGILGVLAGAVSLIIFPHPLVNPSRVRGISLFITPVVTGIVMSSVGAMLRRRGKPVVKIESFPYAYAFAFGMALIRVVRAH
jgi:hypothetical protein